jgi:hypothetical protein
MASIVQLKKSSVVGKVPLTTDLDYGELALNYADGKLYYKKSDGTTIDSFQAGGGSIAVSDDTTTNSSYYPIFATATSGSLSSVKVSSTQFTFNPSNGYFRSGNIGINIAPGSTPLDINHIGALTFGIRVGDNATVTNATGIYLRTTSTATIAWGASGKLVFATSGGSVIRYTIGSVGQFGIGASENFGTVGQVLTSGGPSAAPTWSTPSGSGGITTGKAIAMAMIFGG